LLGLGSFAISARSAGEPLPEKGRVAPFLDRHCVKCHSGDEAEGDLRLDELPFDFDRKETRARWRTVLEQIESGEMPPKEKPRPPADEVRSVADVIDAQLARAEENAGRGKVA